MQISTENDQIVAKKRIRGYVKKKIKKKANRCHQQKRKELKF